MAPGVAELARLETTPFLWERDWPDDYQQLVFIAPNKKWFSEMGVVSCVAVQSRVAT